MSAKSAGTAGARASGAQWVGEPERGSAVIVRIMTFLALRLGRNAGLAMLWLSAAYFYLFAPTARRHSRDSAADAGDRLDGRRRRACAQQAQASRSAARRARLTVSAATASVAMPRPFHSACTQCLATTYKPARTQDGARASRAFCAHARARACWR